MGAFTRVRITSASVNVVQRPKRVKIRQLGGDKLVVVLPFAPVEVSYENIGYEYATIDRPGLKPLLEATTKKLRRVSFTTTVADKPTKGRENIEDLIDKLTKIASDDIDVKLVYGVKPLPFRTRITEFSYSSVHRNLVGQITQAEVSITLEERLNISQGVVALDAIEYEPPSSPGNHGGSPDPDDPCAVDPLSEECRDENNWGGWPSGCWTPGCPPSARVAVLQGGV